MSRSSKSAAAGKRDERRAGGLDGLPVAGAGEHAHPVAGLDELVGHGQQRGDVPDDGRAGDEDG